MDAQAGLCLWLFANPEDRFSCAEAYVYMVEGRKESTSILKDNFIKFTDTLFMFISYEHEIGNTHKQQNTN